MPKVLALVSSYRPAMLADMHRVRLLGWELPATGWDMEVLAPAAAEVRPDAVDGDSSDFFSPDTPVHEFGSMLRGLFTLAGSRSLTWRTLWPAYGAGLRLLAGGRFDLVYVSTTTFSYFVLGYLWRRRLGIPYVLDFHDPWVKPAFTSPAQRFMESLAVSSAAGLVAVSPGYLKTLAERYGPRHPAWLRQGRHAVIPFAAREGDLALLSTGPRAQRPPVADSALTLVYVGAGGDIMRRSFALACRALSALRAAGDPRASRVRIRLHGTTYGWREGDPKLLHAQAVRDGVGDLVEEWPQRVTYRDSLALLARAQGAIVLGVDDAAYMPSKLFTYALSGKPLLACLHRSSRAYALADAPALKAHTLWFDEGGDMPTDAAIASLGAFLREAEAGTVFDRREALAPWLAPAMARAHADLFARCLAAPDA